MSESEMPATLGQAMMTEPLWLQGWVMLLVLTHFAALLFLARKDQGRWRLRPEPLAIMASFLVAALLLEWLYGVVGYVRLLGLGHLIGWTPVYLWILFSRHRFPLQSLFGKYIRVYLLIAGISLVVDAVDVVRYLVGDGELYLRWNGE